MYLDKNASTFIGLKRIGDTGDEWKWVNSDTYNISINRDDWKSGEPDGNGNCVIMTKEGEAEAFSDLDCQSNERVLITCTGKL